MSKRSPASSVANPVNNSANLFEPLSCLCIEVRSAAQVLTRIYDKELEPTGITITQLSQLAAIRKLEGPTLSELARSMKLDRSTLGRNVRLLESLGFVTLEKGTDARSKCLILTKSGRAKLRAAVPIWSRVQDKLHDSLGSEKRALIQELMGDLTSPDFMEISV